ncbi:MAG: hypothetical protein P8177_10520 [Gemmatimonadota bacterium]
MPTKPTPPEPTNTEVRERLGPTYALFEALLEAHPDLEPRWKYYGPRNGWSGRRRGSAGHGKARAVSAGAHAATPDTPPRSAAQRRGRSPG